MVPIGCATRGLPGPRLLAATIEQVCRWPGCRPFTCAVRFAPPTDTDRVGKLDDHGTHVTV